MGLGNKPSIQPPMKLPWKVRLLLSLSGLHSMTRRRDGTVNRRLLSLLDSNVAANPKPVSGVCTSDFTIDSSRNLYARVFVPSDPSIQARLIPIIVFFHGGGFSFYSPSSKPYDTLCRRISRETSAVVVSVNYRLAPEHKYPAAYDDCTDVLRFLDSDGTGSIDALSNLELDFGNCFLAGDSAGGNIVHHVARRWAASTDQNWKKIKLAGAILLQPFFGGEERTESEIQLKRPPLISPNKCDWAWKTFLPEDANRNHEAAHVFNSIKVGIEEAFPPALVVVGGFDPLHDWQIRYYEALKEKGKQVKLVEYPDAFHAFYVFPKLNDTPKLMEEINGFVQANRSI
ncbi:hypothetical protein LUZ61_017761 [Rhynchospora tenuis]|uniref:Alpha/beta hydrolase fold-3 domain-containing protein n=1 Tax=Rhynchospora tenuis TaxID=198213 RepID=A0AAD5Z812_9POAL|nr:hypothetical protein LUZ61_017761 [Rhynchospora tenuis]